jgi:SAM-dependent methyltransferase
MRRCVWCEVTFSGADWRCPTCGSGPADDGILRFTEPEQPDTGFPREAFEHLAALEERHFWFRSRNQLILWALAHSFPDARTLLEVGCGTGVVLAAIDRVRPEISLVAADLFPEGLRVAATRVPTAELLQADARRLPFSDHFDVVCAFDVLEHVEDDRAALNALRRAVRPGGGLLVTVPQHRRLWSAADTYGHHVRRYSARELHEKVTSAGFEIIRSTSWVTLLLPLFALSRMRDRLRPSSFDPERELDVSPSVNRTLELVLSAERACIRLGLSIPLGASRLVIARRP